MLSRGPTEINQVLFSNVGENVFYGGEQSMLISIVMWLYPFPFHYTPKGFGDIEVRGVRREMEYMETSVLPSLKAVLHLTALVDSVVVQNDYGLFADAKREAFHKIDEPVGVYIILSGKPW